MLIKHRMSTVVDIGAIGVNFDGLYNFLLNEFYQSYAVCVA